MLLWQRLLGEHRGDSLRSLFALWRVEQDKFLDLTQLLQQLLHRDARPCRLGLAVHVLQHRDAQHAIERVHADLAVGPMMHGTPAQPLPIFETAKDLLYLLLTRVGGSDLLGAPVHAIGEQHGSAQPVSHQAQPGGVIKIELEMPMPVPEVQLVAEQLGQELCR